MTIIDLNADVGEYQSPEQQELEAALIPLVSSVNIACGGHTGTTETMGWTVAQATKSNIAIGAHPSYPDPQGFGRKPMDVSPLDLYASLRMQIQTLAEIAGPTTLTHLKPHGALYNKAATDLAIADLLLNLSTEFRLPLVGLAGSPLQTRAKAQGVPFIAEGFVDRGYAADGQLIPRGKTGAIIKTPEERCAQALDLIHQGSGPNKTSLQTLCLHSDDPLAVKTAHALHAAFKVEGIEISSSLNLQAQS